MKSVMISIKPKWCELIASGQKTIEVRKTAPKCDVPFKCYIYCTKEHDIGERLWVLDKQTREQFNKPYSLAHMFGANDSFDLMLYNHYCGLDE